MRKTKKTTGTGADRLCLLPDDLLSHIFTFLTVEESVRTSALSKRYRPLYASLPGFKNNIDLNFNTNLFSRFRSFRGFIDRVLNLRDPSMEVNSLTITVGKLLNSETSIPKPSMSEFSGVLNYAISHGVHHISIRNTCRSSGNYPKCLYSAELTTLKLSSSGVSLTEKLCLKQLVSLHLKRTVIESSDFFSSCHCMEELTLLSCRLIGFSLRISAPRLRRVTISEIRDGSEMTFHQEITLSSPKLNFFSFRGLIPVAFFTGDDGLPLLESVKLDVYKVAGGGRRFIERFLPILTNMIHHLRHAKSLTLSYATAESLAVKPELLPQQTSAFEDLKYLHFMGFQWRKTFNVSEYVIAYLVKNPQNAEICYGTPEV